MNFKIIKNLFSFLFISIRKFVYFLLYFLHLLKGEKKNRIIALCYHGVGSQGDYYSLRKSKFIKQLKYLVENYKALSLGDVGNIVDGDKKINKNSFVLTFDDGYRGLLNIKEEIKKLNIKPIIFVLASPDKVDREELANNEIFLSNDDIRVLLADGWGLGCHGMKHKNLFSLNDCELKEEIEKAREILQKEFNVDVESYAYPKGRYNKKIIKIVKDAGFKMAFSMDDGFISSDIDFFNIPRIGINGSHNFIEFKSTLNEGNMMVRKFIKSIFKKIL